MSLIFDTVSHVKAIPLSQVQSSAECYVVDVAGDGAFLARLREMGIEIGAQLRVLHGGRSLLLGVGESRLALRAAEASAVSVFQAETGPLL